MPKYEHAVQVAEFSKDSLTQLKKAFAPSLESLFEARKKTEESSEGKAKKTSVGLLGLLLKPLKRLAILLAAVTAGLVGLAMLFGSKSWVDFGATVSGIMIMLKKWAKIFKTDPPDPDKAKKPGLIKETFNKWVQKYDKLILKIKDSKVVTSVSERWTRMSAAVSNFFKPLTNFLFDEAGTKKPEAKAPPAWTRFAKWFKESSIGRFFGAGGWLLKKMPWLYYGYAFYESTVAGVAAVDRQDELNKAKKFGEATWFEKTKTFSKDFTESAITLLFDKMIIGTSGTISRWLIDEVFPRSWSYDKDGNVKIFGKMYKLGEDWKLGERFTKWRRQKQSDIGDWYEQFVWDSPDTWLGEMDTFIAGVLGIFWDWIGNKVMSLVPKWLRPGKWKNLAGTGPIKDAAGIDKKLESFGVSKTPLSTEDDGQIPGAVSDNQKSILLKHKVFNRPDKHKKWNTKPLNFGSDDASTAEEEVSSMPPSWNKTSKAIADNLHPSFGEQVKEFVSRMWRYMNIDAVVYSGSRGKTEQDSIFNSTNPPGKIGVAYPTSLHNYGGAVDFFMDSGPGVSKDEWSLSNPWSLAGQMAKSLGMKWGGDFKKRDYGHLQINKGYQEARKTMPVMGLEKGGIVRGGHGGIFAWIGEGKQDELVTPLPKLNSAVDPSQRTTAMRNMGADVSSAIDNRYGGQGGITTVVDSSVNTNNATVLAVGNGPYPAPIDDGLHMYSPHR